MAWSLHIAKTHSLVDPVSIHLKRHQNGQGETILIEKLFYLSFKDIHTLKHQTLYVVFLCLIMHVFKSNIIT